jgi:hypothetical protein
LIWLGVGIAALLAVVFVVGILNRPDDGSF